MIEKLSSAGGSKAHVPYRDSKLTRLLRDSLSGTSVSAMLCAISPSSDQFEETLNTLRFASAAGHVLNVPEVNLGTSAVPSRALVAKLSGEVAALREQLASMTATVAALSAPTSSITTNDVYVHRGCATRVSCAAGWQHTN